MMMLKMMNPFGSVTGQNIFFNQTFAQMKVCVNYCTYVLRLVQSIHW